MPSSSSSVPMLNSSLGPIAVHLQHQRFLIADCILEMSLPLRFISSFLLKMIMLPDLQPTPGDASVDGGGSVLAVSVPFSGVSSGCLGSFFRRLLRRNKVPLLDL
ncbi:hypothetical protein QVD17_28553 [Tagetes erecta]|uniref:Uncharacterized protein n=1 Tax=Tagetes erecta TaxID=13708 RepID=A0AAD8NSU7_TARER|nr:hypothetical protein QVD17_28553 [Tagetes erecta]